jgi:hypothetical protein
MNKLKCIRTLSALSVALVGSSVLSVAQPNSATPAKRAIPAERAVPAGADAAATPAKPAEKATPAAPLNLILNPPAAVEDKVKPATPATPAGRTESSADDSGALDVLRPTPPGTEIAAEVKKAVEDAKAARLEFLEQQQELRAGVRNGSKEERARIREVIQQTRADFMAAQRQSREELKKRIIELKDQLQSHQDAIEGAKEEAKDKSHARKEG